MELAKGTRLYSVWLHRWLWFTGEVTRDKKYIFADIAGVQFTLSSEEVSKLKVNK